MKKVVIVGGGASGLICSIIIKQNLGNMIDVTILERLDKVGKKLLATGNGRCNFTNELVAGNKYNHPEFVNNLLNKFGYLETINFFNDLGLVSKVLTEGRVYPNTENASTMLDVLRLECERVGVRIITSYEVANITLKNDCYILEGNNQSIKADYVVLAVGGKAAKVLGSNGSGYELLKAHHIDITKTKPGLVGLKSLKNDLKSLDGIRTKAKVIIKDQKENLLWEELGEVLFKNDGLSGIVSMQASTFINRHLNEQNYLVSLDLLPNLTEQQTLNYLKIKTNKFSEEQVDVLFIGLLNRMISLQVLRKSNIDLNRKIKTLQELEINNLIKQIKNFPVNIKTTYDFDKAQVTIGGVNINEVNKDTLELKKMNNVYVAGELLDIDGECGGYNLQWAWTSGLVVGKDIVEKERGKKYASER